MANYSKDEINALRTLDIDNFRKMSKDNVVEFMSTIKDMKTESALKMLEHIPDLANSTIESVRSFINSVSKSMNLDNEITKKAMDAHISMLEFYQKEYADKDLSPEEKLFLIENIDKILSDVRQMDKDSKIQRLKNICLAGVFTFGSLTLIAAALGVDIKIKPKDMTKFIK